MTVAMVLEQAEDLVHVHVVWHDANGTLQSGSFFPEMLRKVRGND